MTSKQTNAMGTGVANTDHGQRPLQGAAGLQARTRHAGTNGQAAGALAGVRVMDLTNMLSGPYCTRLLADLGAEVIKVEPPEGDHNRGRRPVREGHSSFFGHLNSGKKSIVLNLKKPDDLQSARALAAECDVLVENWRPGVADRLGLGYEALRQLRPDIVYCSISGFGQSGPHASRPAYAPIVHAASGFDLAQMGYQNGDRPQNTATFTADVFGGMSAFAAIQAALFRRERTGEGQYVDVSLLDGMLNLLVGECQEWQAPSNATSRVYPPLATADGFLVIAPTSQKNFEALTEVLGRAEWLSDPRFASAPLRERNWTELMRLIEDWTRTRSSADCEQQLMAQGVPCTRYLTVQQAMEGEQMVARGSMARVEDPSGSYLVPGAPFRMAGMAQGPWPEVPALGEHTEEVLAALALAGRTGAGL